MCSNKIVVVFSDKAVYIEGDVKWDQLRAYKVEDIEQDLLCVELMMSNGGTLLDVC